jgi:hypothetical protein
MSCTTEPCACTPSETSVILYGQLPAQGSPGAKQTLTLVMLVSPACTTTISADLLRPNVIAIPADGRYRAIVRSPLTPGTRCIRATFVETLPGVSDGVHSATTTVSFGTAYPPRDSVALLPAP